MRQGFLYQGQLELIAELDESNNVVTRFIYASGINVPDFMIRQGVYRFVVDHLGSPRLVVNAITGEVAQQLEFNEFGVVSLDSNPGFQPFGFAGAIYDVHSGLMRFGPGL